MRKALIIILFILLSPKSYGEYNGWFIKFEIETTSNTVIIGHVYIASAYFNEDSTNSNSYLLKRFDLLDYNSNGNIHFYKNLLKYECAPYDSINPNFVYTILNEDSIPTNQVRNISVSKMISFGYLTSIGSNHDMKDTTWMKTPPVQLESAGGYFCDWQIFVHDKNEETDRIINEVNTLKLKFTAELQELEEELGYLNGEEYERAKEKIQKKEESMDGQFPKIIGKFNGLKVVVITFCSC